MNCDSKSLYYGLARQVVYLAILTVIVVGFWKIGDVYKNAASLENGFFEVMQSVVLVLTSISFGIQAYKNRTFRPILFLMSMLALTAVIREQDAYFDSIMPTVGWKWCWVFPIIGIACIIRHRNTVIPQMNTFFSSNTFHMMIAAAIVMIPVAQCLGHRSFLADLLNDTSYNVVLVRRILEEPVELIAYITIFLSSIESLVEFRKK